MRATPTLLLILPLVPCGSDGSGPTVEYELHNRIVFETDGGIRVMACSSR
jgi:hypothetical protein